MPENPATTPAATSGATPPAREDRLLFVGCDALDKDILLEGAQAGWLPTFASLLESSMWGETRNPPGYYVGALWPSFYTGTTPAHHGRTCFRQIRPGSYDTFAVDPSHVRGEPFWAALSRAGRKVAVIDVPKCALSRDLNGIHVVDWLTHDPETAGLCTWPIGLAGTLESTYGLDAVGNCNGERKTAEDYLALRNALLSRVGQKLKFCVDLLEQEPWDALAVCFAESHCIGHQCWHLRDGSHPRHDPKLCVGDPIRDVYQEIDRAVGELLARAGSTAIVLASHGIGPHYDATFLLEAVLERLDGVEASATNAPRASSAARRAWRLLPQALRTRMAPLSRQVKLKIDPRARSLASRRFFAVPNNDVHGAIRINLAGREPRGRVRPGAEYEEVLAELEAELKRLVNLETGEPLVQRVVRSAEVYGGAFAHLPDLWIDWNRASPVSAIASPSTGEIRGVYTKCRTGDHRPDGLFFARGPAFGSGRIAAPVRVEDFAPTIAGLLGVELPRAQGASFARRTGFARPTGG